MPPDVVEFSFTESSALQNGQWTWRVNENKRVAVFRCHTCGYEMYVPPAWAVASDGLIATPGGRGLKCGKHASGCTMRGRYMLTGYRAHLKMCD